MDLNHLNHNNHEDHDRQDVVSSADHEKTLIDLHHLNHNDHNDYDHQDFVSSADIISIISMVISIIIYGHLNHNESS